ncbi:MAG: DUF3971 domain-containing protein [Mangrovicoccus sp.]|nr:DUF3971 domain-containing protein [Mangrovicoccus sp.]
MSTPSDPSPGQAPPSRAKRRRSRAILRGFWALLLMLILATLAGLWILSQRPVELGPVLRNQLSRAVAPALAEQGLGLELDHLAIGLRRNLTPLLRARDLRLLRENGTQVHLDTGEVLLDRSALLRGALRPRAIRLSGIQVELSRDVSGDITLAAPGGGPLLQRVRNPGALITQLETGMSQGIFSDLRVLGASEVSLRITDDLAGSVLDTPDADFVLTHSPETLSLRADLGQVGSNDAPGTAQIELDADRRSHQAVLHIALRGIIPADLPGLSAVGAKEDLLERIQTPISLDLTGALDETGDPGPLTGRLSVGAGPILFSDPMPDLNINSVSARLRVDGALTRLDLSDVEIETDLLSLHGRGQVLRKPHSAGEDRSEIIGQLDLRDLIVDAGEPMPAPLHYDSLALDTRVILEGDTLGLDGDLRLRAGDEEIRAQLRSYGPGQVQHPQRRFALDISSAALSRDSLFHLWPYAVFPRTRAWLDGHLPKGELRQISFALRREPAGRAAAAPEPQAALNFAFENAEIRFLDTVAPLTHASGRATLIDKRFELQLDSGQVIPAGAAPVAVTPSLLHVPNVTRKPGFLELDLGLAGPTSAFLSVLARPPFRNDSNAPDLLPADQASGASEIRAKIALPLGPSGGMKAAEFVINGEVKDFTNDSLLPGKTLSAERIEITASQERLEIAGLAYLQGAPMQIEFQRNLDRAPGGATAPEIIAQGALSADLADAFDLDLPAGMLSGAGEITTELILTNDAAPEVNIAADLTGLGIRIPAASLRKPASAPGSLNAKLRLGSPPQVTHLAFDMPGLRGAGSLRLASGGDLALAEIDRLDLGNWLRMRGRYHGPSQGRRARLEINGGSIDLRHSPEQTAAPPRRDDPDLSIRLDQVIISDGLRLTDLRAELPGATGGRGTLRAKVNNKAPFTAEILRQRDGLASILRSQDAGALLAAAGFFSNAKGGALEFRMIPAGPPGHYEGQLTVTDGALHGAGTAAEILSALSVIGAIDQINGEGIVFTEVGARFRLTPSRLILNSAYAEGPSLGLSLDGHVDLKNQNLDLQGAVSPVHFLNRVGGPRRGEGLIGVSFRVTGSPNTPEVEVIPLSLLTPGMLREMFRKSEPAE